MSLSKHGVNLKFSFDLGKPWMGSYFSKYLNLSLWLLVGVSRGLSSYKLGTCQFCPVPVSGSLAAC